MQRCRKYYFDNIERERQIGRENYKKDRERQIAGSKLYYKIHREKYSIYNREWRERNKDWVRERARKWCNLNYAKVRMYYAHRQKNIATATPKWADFRKIESIYAECKNRSDSAGVPHHVDHIVPLVHPLICGLHVDENLQIITKSANSKKGNRYSLPGI